MCMYAVYVYVYCWCMDTGLPSLNADIPTADLVATVNLTSIQLKELHDVFIMSLCGLGDVSLLSVK